MNDASLAQMGITIALPQEEDQRLSGLRRRAARCVCRGCGQRLTPVSYTHLEVVA